MIPQNVNRPLKTVALRVQSCRAVVQAIDAHSDHLAVVLGATYGPLLEDGQTMPFPTQLALFRKQLIKSRDGIVTTDRAYRDQRALESVFRGRRDLTASDVYSRVVGLRQSFTGIYSDDRLAEFGFARRTPRQADELLEYATHLVERLSDPDLDLSGSVYENYQIDPLPLLAEVVEAVPKLRQAVEALGQQERRSEALLLAKDAGLEKHNQTFLWTARTVESLFRLAGLEEVARRVRPSSRRIGVIGRLSGEPDDSDSSASQESTPETGSQETPATA